MKWAQKNKNAILWALTIIVIILIIILSKPKDRGGEVITNEEAGEEANSENTSSSSESAAEIAAADGYVYDFSGIQWEFDTEDLSVPEGQTWLKMRFADFARNGSVINLRNPYKLGFHAGVCKEVSFIDTTAVDGIPLSYVQCVDGSTIRDIVVLQQLDHVVVKYMDTVDGVSNPSFSDLYSIDVKTIVK